MRLPQMLLAGSALIGAVRPAGDATFDKITCKEWVVVDKDGTERIGAATFADGNVSLALATKDKEPRIIAAIKADGGVIYPTKDRK